MFLGYIYMTTNIVNGKIYIGQHTGEEWTLQTNYIGSGRPYFKNALNKYGKDNFMNQLIMYCCSQEELDIMEEVFIKVYKSTDRNIGYNVSKNACGGDIYISWIKENDPEKYKEFCNNISKNKIRSKKISLSNKNKPKSEEHKNKLRKPKSKEHKDKLSILAKERLKNPEKHPMYGKHHSEETKQKMRHPKSEEHKNKLRKPKSEETKQKISTSLIGHKQSEYTITLRGLKISLGKSKKKNNLESIIELENEISTIERLK